jgi:phage-related protein
MTINGYRFIYAGQSSDIYGVIKCDIGSINEESNDESSEIITSTTPFRQTYSLHSVEKSEPLKFKLTICREDGEFIDADFEEDLKEWLCKEEYHWLSIDQDDMYDKMFYCAIINPQKVNVGRMSGGIQFDVICDSQYAWTNLRKKTYSTVDGTLIFNFNNTAKINKYVLSPTLTITIASDGDIRIKNNTTNQLITIDNCVVGEIITLDCENEIAESSTNRILVDDWNVEFLEIIKGNNSITITGNFTMTMEYRLPVRIGG